MVTIVLVAAAWCVVALVAAVVLACRRGGPRVHAEARGRASAGWLYAFGPAMWPWAKDGVRRHPLALVFGLALHLGLGVASVVLAGVTLGGWRAPSLPAALRAAASLLLVAAVVSGVALLVRRARDARLRSISVPDDYLSNGLVTLWLAATATWCVEPGAEPWLLLAASAVLFYAPLGKIRHCVFYPIARAALGTRLGRRGVVGAGAHGVRA